MSSFILPPRIMTAENKHRRVGFEIEFGGLPLEKAAQIVQEVFGGQLERRNQYAFRVTATSFGDFSVESDSRILSEMRYEKYFDQFGIESGSILQENIEKVIEKLSGTLVPLEIAFPPLPITELESAEKVRKRLQEASAVGISSSLFAAFGMQINVELPDLKAKTILSYLRAFFMLHQWLSEKTEVALARKIAPFINPFPNDYQELVLNWQYEPSLHRLISDYLIYNPTRNRPLDLLPLFAYLDEAQVFASPVEVDLVKARPAFHYRLPNSEIDDPDWSFAIEWNKWVQVEILAERLLTSNEAPYVSL